MASGFGSFVSGLQGGMEFQENRRRSKRINRALDYELDRIGLEQEGRQATHARALEAEGRDPMDYSQFGVAEDPYQGLLSKAFTSFSSGLKDMFTRGQPAGVPPTALEKPEMDYQDGVPSYAIENYADGGDVDDWRRDRVSARERVAGGREGKGRVGRYVAKQGGARDLLNKSKMVKGGAALAAADAIADQTEVGYGERMDERFGDWGWGGEDKGKPSIGGALEYGVKRGLGFASDLGDALTFGQASRLYRDERDEFGFGPEQRVPREQAAAVEASDVAAQPDEAAERPNQAGTAVQPPPTAAPQAVQERAGPVQFSDAPIVPVEEMPSMSTQDWVAYRSASVADMIAMGASAEEAHKSVTAMQMRGFQTYAQQAFQFLGMGDPGRAGMAMKAAYQYFPNGADVKFGMTKDAQGQPALVAMGTNEETGEPQGKPMLITQERLAAMVNNLSDPAAFTAWTKDWRDEEFKRRKYEEQDLPTAQSEADYRARMGQAALNRSEADLISASSAGARGGLKQSDIDRGLSAIESILGDSALMREIPEADLDYLSEVAAIVYQSNPGNSTATIRRILSLYREGGTAAVDQWVRGG